MMAGLLDYLRDHTAATPVNPILKALGWNSFPAKNNEADTVADALAERKAARARDGLEPFRFDWSKPWDHDPGANFQDLARREYDRQQGDARRTAAYVNNMPNPSEQILTAAPPTRAGILGTLVGRGLEYLGAPRGVQHDAGAITRSMAEGALLGTLDKLDSGDVPGALEYLIGGPALGMVKAPAKKALPTVAAKAAEDNLASRVAAIYDFPTVNRPFSADYPEGAAHEAGKLLTDINGRPFNANARFVAGRRVVGDSEEALGPQELIAIGEAGTGRRVETIAPSKIDGDVGRVTVHRYTREPEQVYLSNKLSEDLAGKVIGHESGHVIDQLLKELPLPKGKALQELKLVYNEGNNTDLAQARGRNYDIEKYPRKVYKGVTPEAMGYKGDKVRGEYWAEALRAYLTSPGWFKSAAPEAAAIIRRHVNNHPKLKDLIQFNGLAAATAPVGLLGYLAEQDEQ